MGFSIPTFQFVVLVDFLEFFLLISHTLTLSAREFLPKKKSLRRTSTNEYARGRIRSHIIDLLIVGAIFTHYCTVSGRLKLPIHCSL